ncbi:hypothetical protein [Gordonia sp. DT101]|uniref:hypothetical protein n=1 Tax=Gordonia sp. DT101 TaxID=3416545 RepID=UPI003CF4EF1F
MADDGSKYFWNASDGGKNAGSAGGSSSGSTDWQLAIQQMLSRIASMEPGSAGADAAALQQAIDAAIKATERLKDFGQDGLEGHAARGSAERATRLATEITSGAKSVSGGVGALATAQGILAAAKVQEPFLQQMQKEMEEKPEDAADIMTRAASLMTSLYNGPMSSAAGQAPDSIMNPTVGSALISGSTANVVGGSGGGGGNSGGGSTHTTVGGSSDLGEYGNNGASTTAATPTDAGTAAQAPTSKTETSGDKPLSLGNDAASSGGGADDPDDLSRGGLGSANNSGSSAFPSGMMPAGGAAGATGAGGKVGGVGAGAGGSGAAGGANAASAMSRRLSGAMPTPAPTSTTPASSTAPLGAGPGRAGGPMGGAPHGGRARGSDDRSHKAAHYLHTQENGAELVGSLPLVGPPVIGDWSPPQAPEAAESSASKSGEADGTDKDLKL